MHDVECWRVDGMLETAGCSLEYRHREQMQCPRYGPVLALANWSCEARTHL